jgi:VWFA-related protein
MLISANHTGCQRAWEIAALLALALSPAAAAVDPNPETVSVYLNVEKGGSLISGLSQGNFRFYQDGKPQPFRLEKPEEPTSIALLVEYSRSSGYFIEDIDTAMRDLLKHAPEGHWYALATFSQDLEIHTDFTQQIGRITEGYSQLGVPMRTEINTYEAVHEMLDKMGRLPGRRFLILVGSGLDTFSEHNLDDVKKKLEAENVTIFVAGVGSAFRTSYDAYLDSSSRMSFLLAQGFLKMLADKSGGFAWFPNHFNAFPDVMLGIMQSVATQYRLVYDTTVRGSGRFHKIRVEAFRIVNDKREDFKVLVREGWR